MQLTEKVVARFCAALLPPDHGGPDPNELAGQVQRYLARVPGPARAGVLAGMAAFSIEAATAPEPSTAMARMARHLGADVVDGLKAVVLLVAGAHQFADEMHDRAVAGLPVRPDPALDVTSASHVSSSLHADAVVIGSGAGGAMVARTLARAGLDVVVLEEGRRHTVGDFRQGHPLDRFADTYRDSMPTVVVGRPPVVLPIGRAVGGSTLVNSGTCYRPPDEVLHRWSADLGVELAGPGALTAYLDDVEATIGVAPVPLDVMGRNGRLAMTGAESLGWRTQPLLRNAPGCEGCCQCSIGCPRNAKAGVHLNALPQACAAGARIISELRVSRVLHEDGRTTGVIGRRLDGSGVTVSAPVVVVAAGATETPPLLRRSGLGRHPEMGRNLALHPALAAGGRFPDPVVAWDGVLQSAAVDELHHSHRILIEATSTPPGMGSMALPGVGPDLMRELDRADRYATLGAMIGDGPWGRVRGRRAGQTLVTYRLPDEAGGRLRTGLRAMAEVLFAAGAHEVVLSTSGAHPLASLDEVDQVLSALPISRLHLAAFHPTGTARMGADDQWAPVDEAGRLRGVHGVWVADASVLPTCPDVNPQVTIMAMALAIAAGIAGEAGADGFDP